MVYSRIASLVLVVTLTSSMRADPLQPHRLVDVDGETRQLAGHDATTVIIFLGTQCPVSNRYVPMLNELAAQHQKDDVQIFGVVSDPTVSRKDAAAYRDQYKITFPLIFDASGTLARELHPTATPEAFVIDRDGNVGYRGRIDDGFVAIGKQNQVVKSHDLADALSAVLENRAVAVAETKPVGCAFEAWDKKDLAGKATYARDIAPILNANCVSCHRTNEIAPFPLDNFTDAAKRAKQLVAATESRYMPPWKPAPNFGHFQGEHRLADREIELINTWADAGAPEGDAKDLPPAPKFASGWQLGTPDMVVKMPQPFTIPAGGDDIYQAFVVPLNLAQDTYVAGIEFRPDAKTVVHHTILYLDNTGAARALDEKDPAPGYRSFGGPGFTPTGSLGGWAPGATSSLLPDGVGRPVRANSDLVFQMHYHPDGREHTDQSSVAIYLQKKPITKVVASIPVGTRQIDIAPGDANYARTINFTLPVDLMVIGAIPHMHLLGRTMSVSATAPDGKLIPLIKIDDWDFRWQGQYRYVEPVTLPSGSTIHFEAKYDNSSANSNNPTNPPKRVTHGEQTTDEMCLCFLEFMADSPSQSQAIRRAVGRAIVANAIRERLGAEAPTTRASD